MKFSPHVNLKEREINEVTRTMSVAKITCVFVNFDVIVSLIKSLL